MNDPFHPLRENPAPALHSLEDVARATGFSRRTVALFCRAGFIVRAGPEPAWLFDDDALHLLRLLARLHHQHGLDLAGLRLVGTLLAEVERLRAEVRFHRGR
jgi:hypothetical protein